MSKLFIALQYLAVVVAAILIGLALVVVLLLLTIYSPVLGVIGFAATVLFVLGTGVREEMIYRETMGRLNDKYSEES